MRITRARLRFMHIWLLHQGLCCFWPLASLGLIISACGLPCAASAVAVGGSNAARHSDGPVASFEKNAHKRICAVVDALLRQGDAFGEKGDIRKWKGEGRGKHQRGFLFAPSPVRRICEIYEMYAKTARILTDWTCKVWRGGLNSMGRKSHPAQPSAATKQFLTTDDPARPSAATKI